MSALTPEQILAKLLQQAGSPERMALAEQLRRGSGQQYSTPIGAALGGLGNILSKHRGTQMMNEEMRAQQDPAAMAAFGALPPEQQEQVTQAMLMNPALAERGMSLVRAQQLRTKALPKTGGYQKTPEELEALAALAQLREAQAQKIKNPPAADPLKREALRLRTKKLQQELDRGPSKPTLSSGERDELQGLGAEVAAIESLASRFKDEYAGGGPLSSAKIATAQTLGGLAPQGMQEAAAFWADFQSLVDLPQRNKIFGASLSAGEKAAWEGARNIRPGVDPKIARAKFAELIGIAKRKRDARAGALKDEGFKAEAVDRLSGQAAPPPGLTPEEAAELQELEKKFGGKK